MKKLLFGLLGFLSASSYAAIGGGIGGSFIQNQNTLQANATFYVSSGTARNFNTNTIKFSDGTTQTTAASGGGGGSSTMQTKVNGVQISSPTKSLALDGNFTGSESPTGTANISLNPGCTFFIQNTNSLQSGATIYVSSESVSGPLSVFRSNFQALLLPSTTVPFELINTTSHQLYMIFKTSGTEWWRLGSDVTGLGTPEYDIYNITTGVKDMAISTNDVMNINATAAFPSLTASRPMKLNASKQVTSGLIDVTSEITGTVPDGSLPANLVHTNVAEVISSSHNFTAQLSADSLKIANSTISINGVQYTNWPASLGLATTSSGVFVVNGSSQVSIQPAVTDAAEKDSYNAMTATTNFVAGSTIQVLGSMLDSSLTAGTSGYAWTTRGAGLSPQWLPQSGSGGAGTPGGSNQQMQYNNSGSFGGIAVATFNATTNLLTFSSAVTHVSVSSDTFNNVRIVLSGTSAIQYPDGTVQTSSPTAGGNFINNQATLQSGATFYVSSGTVSGDLYLRGSNGTSIQQKEGSSPPYTRDVLATVGENVGGGSYRVIVSTRPTFGLANATGYTSLLLQAPTASVNGSIYYYINGSNPFTVSPGTAQVTGDLIADRAILSSLTYPTADGSTGQFMKTDGSGNLSFASIANSGVTAGSYGTASNVSSFTVAADGRITGAANVPIAISGSAVSGGTFGAVNGSALTNLTPANISGGVLGNTVQVSSLAAVVTAGSYGSATVSNTITFNAQGQIIGASSNTIVAGAAQDFDLKDSTGSFNRLIDHSSNPIVGVSSISFSGTYDSGGKTWAIRPSTFSHVPGGSVGSITFTGASSHTVEGLQFWAVANSTFTGRFVLSLNSSSSNAVGWKFLMLGPASPVFFTMTGGGSGASGTTANFSQQATALATKTASFLGTYGSGAQWYEFDFTLITGATPGYVNVQIVPATGAGNNFINSESYITAVMD